MNPIFSVTQYLLGLISFFELLRWLFSAIAPSRIEEILAATLTATIGVIFFLSAACFAYRRLYIDELERKVEKYNHLEAQLIKNRLSSNPEPRSQEKNVH